MLLRQIFVAAFAKTWMQLQAAAMHVEAAASATIMAHSNLTVVVQTVYSSLL